MKKKIIAIALGLSMMAALVACGNKEISNDKITIEQYKGLEVEVETIEVTDEDIEMSIQSTLETMATRKEITDRAAQAGDEVTIDYEGKVDGVAFDGGTAKEQVIEIGAGLYIPGFEEGIIGHVVGETFDVPVTFPEDYSEELAGKAAVFTMTLHKIEEVTIPELTEELLPSLSETAKTIYEYKKEVKKDLEKSNEETIEAGLESKAWEALIEKCTVKEYPQSEIDEFIAYVDEQLGEMAEANGTTAADYFEQYYGMTPTDYIKNSYKVRYAIELIAEKEKITLTAEEYEDGLSEAAANDGYTDVAEYEKQIGRETLELQLLQPKVGAILIENCKRVPAKTADAEK